MIRYLALLVIGTAIIAGCNRQPPPRSSTEFVENPMLLEAAMVRCAQDREKSRYDAECLNARAAAMRIQAEEEARRQAELEEQSMRKREELRRAQAAADEAALLEEQRRKDAEYLAEFGELPPADSVEETDETAGNLPIAVIPETDEAVEAVEADEADKAEQAAETVGSDLEAVREELRRRAEEGDN